MEINNVCSLGTLCHTAQILKRNKLKVCSYPFDWIFSNCDNIMHCIEDDFKIFLDKSYYINISYSQRGHSYYNNNMFVHHNPLGKPEHYDYFIRCVNRFKNLLKSKESKLFIFFFPNMNCIDEYNKNKIEEFNNRFLKFTENYKILAIFHLYNKKVLYHKFTNNNNNVHFLELHTLTSSNGLEFSNKIDNDYLDFILKKTYNFKLKEI